MNLLAQLSHGSCTGICMVRAPYCTVVSKIDSAACVGFPEPLYVVHYYCCILLLLVLFVTTTVVGLVEREGVLLWAFCCCGVWGTVVVVVSSWVVHARMVSCSLHRWPLWPDRLLLPESYCTDYTVDTYVLFCCCFWCLITWLYSVRVTTTRIILFVVYSYRSLLLTVRVRSALGRKLHNTTVVVVRKSSIYDRSRAITTAVCSTCW